MNDKKNTDFEEVMAHDAVNCFCNCGGQCNNCSQCNCNNCTQC